MGAIDKLMKRWGFARLDQYGLILTPEGRVLATRTAILDDGLGGRIVGWREGDLAAMELQAWEPAHPTRRQTATPTVPVRMAMPRPNPAPRVVLKAPAAVVAQPPPLAARVIAPAAPIVAPEPVVEEDEWEWEIAMARARAAAEWVAEAAATIPAPRAATQIRAADPIADEAWPKTEPLHESWDTSDSAPNNVLVRVPRITKAPVKAIAAKQVAKPAPEGRRATVIPVPTLPATDDPRAVRPPLVSRPASVPVAPRRFPRSTGRVEDTIRTHAAPPANEDKTSPSIALPPSAASGGKRVAAKQR